MTSGPCAYYFPSWLVFRQQDLQRGSPENHSTEDRGVKAAYGRGRHRKTALLWKDWGTRSGERGARGAWRGPCFLRLSDAHPAPKKTYQQGLAGTSGRSSKGQGVRIGGQEGRRHSEAASAPAPLLSSRPHGWPRRDSGTGPCPSAPARIKEKHREVSQGENTGNLAFVFKNRAKQLNYVIKSVKCYLWSTSGFFLKCWLFDWI